MKRVTATGLASTGFRRHEPDILRGMIVRAHIIWSALMTLVAFVIAAFDGVASGATASWLLLAVPVSVVIFTITFPLNALGFLVVRRLRGRLVLQLIATVLLGGLWFVVGEQIGDRSQQFNATAAWLGIGGVVFGLAVMYLGQQSRADGARKERLQR